MRQSIIYRNFRLIALTMMALMIALPLPSWASEEETAPEEGKLAIELAPFIVPLLERGRQQGKLDLTLTIVVQKQRDSEMIRYRLPQIRSDFLGALTSLARQRFSANRPVDPDLITAYLSPFLDQRVGQGKAKIYVQHAVVSPT